MTELRKRSNLPGELAASVDQALLPDDEIVYEIKTYRGHGLVMTQQHLLFVAGGLLAGLKAHEHHVLRVAYTEIASIELVTEKPGCIWVFGLPQTDLVVNLKDSAKQDPRWTTLTVDYLTISPAFKLACLVSERIGQSKSAG